MATLQRLGQNGTRTMSESLTFQFRMNIVQLIKFRTKYMIEYMYNVKDVFSSVLAESTDVLLL